MRRVDASRGREHPRCAFRHGVARYLVGLCALFPSAVALAASGDPTALPGGPYTLTTGGSIALRGGASSSPLAEITKFEWDIDGDGQFGELGGPEPTLVWSWYRWKTGDRTVSLRVTDAKGRKATASTKVSVVASRLAVHDAFRFTAGSAGQPGEPVFGWDGRLYGVANLGAGDGRLVLWRMDANGRGFIVLRRFETLSADDGVSGPVVGPDGRLYGTSNTGGAAHRGSLWRINADGTDLKVLREFDSLAGGGLPLAAPTFGPDAKLYGICADGGEGFGTIWRINPDGTGFKVLRAVVPPEGVLLSGSPLFAPNGYLYGVALYGGATDDGTLWRMKPDGTDFSVLKSFHPPVGVNPAWRLFSGADGKLYGVTTLGGGTTDPYGPNPGHGTVWRIALDGSGFEVLRIINAATDGESVRLRALGADGRLYGTSGQYSAGNEAYVWRMNRDGTAFSTVRTFDSSADGSPSGLVLGRDGQFYGSSTIAGSGKLWRMQPAGTGYAVLREMKARNNGYLPYGPPVFASATLYGLTYAGGKGDAGVLWRMKLDGSGFGVVHEFESDQEGSSAYGSVALHPQGALWGTSPAGGRHGFGTLWSIPRAGGSLAVLRHFQSETDGGYPQGEPVFSADGVAFGTNLAAGMYDGGTLWRIERDGTRFKVLRHFSGSSDGANPAGSPVVGPDGLLYGANFGGGANGAGTLWRVRQDGTQFKVLKHFVDATEGSLTSGAPVIGRDGWLYGANILGGAHGFGTLWRVNRDGTGFAVLHHFEDEGDAAGPQGSPAFGSDGRLYGVGTTAGGDMAEGFGTLWRIKTDGTGYEVCVHFGAMRSGLTPMGGVRFGPDGRLYGSATGGRDGLGVVYSAAK